MSDTWVAIHHPDGRDGYVTQFAFDVLWSKKGFLPGKRSEVTPEIREDGIEVVISGGEPVTEEPDEAEQLRERLRSAGIKVDKRWGLKRLRAEAAMLEDAE